MMRLASSFVKSSDDGVRGAEFAAHAGLSAELGRHRLTELREAFNVVGAMEMNVLSTVNGIAQDAAIFEHLGRGFGQQGVD
jgi:hypothetical protein